MKRFKRLPIDERKRRIALITREGAIHIADAAGRGVGTSVAGAEDAKRLARESAERVRRLYP